MAIDDERNRVLAALQDQPDGANSSVLGEYVGLVREVVERYLFYSADYGLAAWKRVRSGLGHAVHRISP
jgi:hypothetical protein